MDFMPSQRGATPSIVEKLAKLACELETKQGKKIIRLQVGQPSTGAPKAALQAAIKAINQLPLGYTQAAGITPLRQRLAQHYLEQYGVHVDQNRIIVSIGASGAMILAIVGCFDVGARIGLPMPFYSGYRHALGTLGIHCVPFGTSSKHKYQPTVQDIEKIPGGIDGLIIASPGNPTGSMLSPAELNALATYCQTKKIRLISDEIYHGITYQKNVPAASAIQFSQEAIVVNSFSKYYSMPGWRLGWMVAPDYLVEPLINLAHNLYLSPPAPSQYAGLAALDCREELDQNVIHYAHNRDILLRELPQAGFDQFMAPDGAFYFYCHVDHMGSDSMKFCIEALHECGVLMSPGIDYDPTHGHKFVRMSYAGSTEDIEEAMDRLKKWVQMKKS